MLSFDTQNCTNPLGRNCEVRDLLRPWRPPQHLALPARQPLLDDLIAAELVAPASTPSGQPGIGMRGHSIFSPQIEEVYLYDSNDIVPCAVSV